MDRELDDVATRTPMADSPVIRLDSCPNAVVRDCLAYRETEIFLSVPPGSVPHVFLKTITLEAAHKTVEEAAGQFWHTIVPATEGC